MFDRSRDRTESEEDHTPSHRLVHFVVVAGTTALTGLAWLVAVNAADLRLAQTFSAKATQTAAALEAALLRSEQAVLALAQDPEAGTSSEIWSLKTVPWLSTQSVVGPQGLARIDATSGTVLRTGTFTARDQVIEPVQSIAGRETLEVAFDPETGAIAIMLSHGEALYMAEISIPAFLVQEAALPVDGIAATIGLNGLDAFSNARGLEQQLDHHFQITTENVELSLHLVATPSFGAEYRNSSPTIILMCGLIIDAAIVALFILLSRSRRQSQRSTDELSAQLQAEKIQLEASNIALERYAQMSSHDLRTPLRAIRDLQDELADDMAVRFPDVTDDSRFKDRLSQTAMLLRRMDRLIDGTLEYTQLAHHLNDYSDVDLNVLLQRLSDKYQTQSVALIVKGHWPIVQCSLKLLTVILENLVQNAIQHHPWPDRARVTLHSETSENTLIMQISDNGDGVEERFQDRIFDMFQTLSPAHQSEATGLGLAIVKRAVTLIGGHISVRSERGKGATFSVMLHDVVDGAAKVRQVNP